MASKSKDVRIEQLRIFEKKLELRLQQIAQKGISEKKAQSDPLIKSLKSKIRETNVRIAVFEKFVQRTQELAQVKAQKIAELAAKKEEKSEPVPALVTESSPATKQAEPKQKKRVTTDKVTPKKPKKQPAATDEATPKKRTSNKKEE